MSKSQIRKPRILFWDIETTHNVVATFRLFGEDYIPHTNIIQERYIVCAAWKWEGEDKIHTVSTLDDPKRFKANPHDDYHVVKKLHDVLSEADVIVAHNGDAYDIKFFKGRAIAHGLAPIPPIKSVDTKKVAKTHFMFNSNRLDYLGQFLGVGRKLETRPGLWMEVLTGTDSVRRAAIKDMVTYNIGDISLLEDVFNKLRPYVKNLNINLYTGERKCPYCGSEKVQSRGTAVDESGLHFADSRVYRRFQCRAKGCMGWFRMEKPEPTRKAAFKTI